MARQIVEVVVSCDWCFVTLSPEHQASDSDLDLCRKCSRQRKFAIARSTLKLTKDGSFGNAITPKRQAILELLIAGFTNQEMANALVISPRTVESHIRNLLLQFNATSRLDLAIIAIENELVTVKKGR